MNDLTLSQAAANMERVGLSGGIRGPRSDQWGRFSTAKCLSVTEVGSSALLCKYSEKSGRLPMCCKGR